MKLQNIINIRFLLLTTLIFSFAGLALYYILGLVVDNNVDEMLKARSERVKKYLLHAYEKGVTSASPDQSVVIKEVSKYPLTEMYTDTVLYEAFDDEYVGYRKMTLGFNNGRKVFKITIIMSKLETHDMIRVVFYFMLGLFAFITFVLFFLNRWISLSVWKPFFNILEKLKSFKIGDKREIQFAATNVYEFRQLNEVLSQMVQKMQNDYINLKVFSENASHEIQTPLAIIKSKLEMVLQDKTLSSERYHQIRIAYESASRLSKLNGALLLLSKIENQQFGEEKNTELCELINQRLEFIEDLIVLKKVKVSVNFLVSIKIRINPYLAEILINNILSNALKHNFEEGQIHILSVDNKITFSNTGEPLTIAPEKLGQRFVKQNAGSESTGLGLAIVSQICKVYKHSFQYEYNSGLHSVTILFNQYDSKIRVS